MTLFPARQAAPRILAAFLFVSAPLPAELKPETVRQFEDYMRDRDAAVRHATSGPAFLWLDREPARLRSARQGEIVVAPYSPKNPISLDGGGLVHDWIGGVFIPGATLESVLHFVQDYDNHHKIYPEVVASRLLNRKGDDFRIRLRLRKHKIITVFLNTEHSVRYSQVDAHKAYSRSSATKIAEIDDAGQPSERELPPGDDHGFLWRLESYWRFLERDGGVYIECEAVSLTRGIPFGLGVIVKPIINDLPAESLQGTLGALRDALKR